jgi:hypothetical protein
MKKANNISALIWAISCYFFAFIIFFTTKFFTHDPNFSGGVETPWLIPMLGCIGVGGISFGIMILSGIISILKKENEKANLPLGLNSIKSTISVIILVVISFIFLFGVRNGNLGYKKANFNGQQLFDEINNYRQSKGINLLELDPILCDNLVDRWLAIKNPDNGHDGFEQWLKNEGIVDNKKYGQIGELYISTVTAKDAINFWQGSPGHRSTLEMKSLVYGCAYANEGIGVVIVAEKR